MTGLRSFSVGAHSRAPEFDTTTVRATVTNHPRKRVHGCAPLQDDDSHIQTATTVSRRTALRFAAALSASLYLPTNRLVKAQPTYPGNGEPPLLVDPAWLQQRTSAPDAKVRILDCSELRTYKDEHIPEAVHAWWQDTMDPNKPVYGGVLRPGGELPDGTFDQSPRIQLLEDLGIDDQTYVVVYDDDRGRWAAHMVWFLRFLGHHQAAMLNGGLVAWRDSGFETESGENSPPKLDQPTVTPQEGFYVETRDFERLLDTPNTVVLDVRSESEVNDDLNGNLPIGRIPSSVSLPWTMTLADDAGRILDPASLEQLFADHGVSPQSTVVVYGRFGVEASHTWLALRLTGHSNVTVFDGGWASWASDPSHPIDPL